MHNIKKIPKKTREFIKYVTPYDRKCLTKVRRILKRNNLEAFTESPETFRISKLVLIAGKKENYEKAKIELLNLDDEIYSESESSPSYDTNTIKIYDLTITYTRPGLPRKGFNRLY